LGHYIQGLLGTDTATAATAAAVGANLLEWCFGLSDLHAACHAEVCKWRIRLPDMYATVDAEVCKRCFRLPDMYAPSSW
jgi:hypothetical protein